MSSFRDYLVAQNSDLFESDKRSLWNSEKSSI